MMALPMIKTILKGYWLIPFCHRWRYRLKSCWTRTLLGIKFSSIGFDLLKADAYLFTNQTKCLIREV